jgi:hypothetical protein
MPEENEVGIEFPELEEEPEEEYEEYENSQY